MKEVEGVNTLVTLDVFVAPIGNDDIQCARDDFKECSDFDGSLNNETITSYLSRPVTVSIESCRLVMR
jgi:hypothetical protein